MSRPAGPLAASEIRSRGSRGDRRALAPLAWQRLLALLCCLLLSLAAVPGEALGRTLDAPGQDATQAAPTQPAVAPGALVALQGTPHLWIGGEDGALHWAGDTRALGEREVDWGARQEVDLEALRRAPRGAPWLSVAMVKLGDPIYLAKWETDAPRPTLLQVRSIADLELFGVDGSTYGALVLDEGAWERRYGFPVQGLARGELVPAVPVAAPPGPDPRSREYVTQTIDGAPSGTAYTLVPYWSTQVNDDRLLLGLALAATHNGDWREQVGSRLAARETAITFGPLPEDAGGLYVPARNRITINPGLAAEPGALAAVLAHEVYHAVAPKEPGPTACLNEEIAAFTWQARTWSALPAPRRTAGRWGRFNDSLVRAWQAGRVDDVVLATPAYREQCRAP